VGITTQLHVQAGVWARTEVGRHDRCRSSQKCEWIDTHAFVPQWHEGFNPINFLLGKNLDGITPVICW
jgi:hypothetical protein